MVDKGVFLTELIKRCDCVTRVESLTFRLAMTRLCRAGKRSDKPRDGLSGPFSYVALANWLIKNNALLSKLRMPFSDLSGGKGGISHIIDC